MLNHHSLEFLAAAQAPWKGPQPPLFPDVTPETFTQEHLDALATQAGKPVYTGADALTGNIVKLPAGRNAYMSYADGFGGFGELEQRFGTSGHPYLVSISVNNNPAHCADMESGAMSPGDFPAWLDHKAVRSPGEPPWGYTPASQMQEVINAAGNRAFIRWSAHVGHGPHICGPSTCGFPQVDWTQWAFGSGTNTQAAYDQSIGTWLPSAPRPKPPSYHYGRFATGPFVLHHLKLDERSVVQRYDAYRKEQRPNRHPHRAQLALLRLHLRWLAGRLAAVAHKKYPHLPISEALTKNPKEHWGWRYGQLSERGAGNLVKPV